MAKKGTLTQAAPLKWEQLQTLTARMTYDIEKKNMHPGKKMQLSRFLLLVNLGCYTGLRIGDLLQLSWLQVYEKDELVVTEKKTSKTRRIAINPNLQQIVNDSYDRIQPTETREHMFLNTNGEVLSVQYINRRIKKLLTKYKIKVKAASSHTFRKTFGLRCFEQNERSEYSLILLSQIFNHSNVAITRRYIGIQEKQIENVYLSL